MNEISIYEIDTYSNTGNKANVGDVVLFGLVEKTVVSMDRNELYFSDNSQYGVYIAEVLYVRNPILEIKNKLKDFN